MDKFKQFARTHMLVGTGFALALLLLLFGILFYRPVSAADGDKLITIYDNNTNSEQTIATKATTVGDALKRANVEVGEYDAVEPGLQTELKGGVYNVNVYRARLVTVIDGNLRSNIVSPYQSAHKIAESAGITTYSEDNLELSPIDFTSGSALGLKLTIDRATPFTFVLYGKASTARTQAATVGEMLKEKGVKLGPNDGTNVPLSTPITKDMNVAVWRNGVQTITQEEEVPFTVRQVKDMAQEIGYKKIQTPGVKGKKLVTYQINMQNGVEVSRQAIQEVIQSPASEQVEIVGGKATNTFSGSFAEALARLRSCEGSYTSNTGNGYYGAYQFDRQTWGGYGGYTYASDAPPSVQDERAWQTYQRRGWQPWPSCSSKMGLQDIYR